MSILLWLADAHPEARLSPTVTDGKRPAYLSVLDLYVATASRWSPGRRRFSSVAPGLAEAIGRVDTHPRLTKLWAERLPFVESWEE